MLIIAKSLNLNRFLLNVHDIEKNPRGFIITLTLQIDGKEKTKEKTKVTEATAVFESSMTVRTAGPRRSHKLSRNDRNSWPVISLRIPCD